MARELCSSLAQRGRAGRTIGIKVRLDDFTTVTRAHSVPEPTCDEQVVCAHALRLLREYAPQRPVRLLGVRVAGLAGSRGQHDESDGSDVDEDGASRGRAQLALPL
jgi:DNA polymerase-4